MRPRPDRRASRHVSELECFDRHAVEVNRLGVNQARTFWVKEEDPPTWPPWACEGRNFETPEEALAWALPLARTVMIQTLTGSVYYAGERPSEFERSADAPPWPPPSEDAGSP
jgi:hypothetical protein